MEGEEGGRKKKEEKEKEKKNVEVEDEKKKDLFCNKHLYEVQIVSQRGKNVLKIMNSLCFL